MAHSFQAFIPASSPITNLLSRRVGDQNADLNAHRRRSLPDAAVSFFATAAALRAGGAITHGTHALERPTSHAVHPLIGGGPHRLRVGGPMTGS